MVGVEEQKVRGWKEREGVGNPLRVPSLFIYCFWVQWFTGQLGRENRIS